MTTRFLILSLIVALMSISRASAQVYIEDFDTISYTNPPVYIEDFEYSPVAADTIGNPLDDIPSQIMLIPDSLAAQVKDVLDGKSRIVKNPNFVDPDDKVVFRGDTIPMFSKGRNFSRYDRGLLNWLFVPKGIWAFGLTASYGEFDTSDLQIIDLLTDFDFHGHTFSIRPSISYFINNNMSVGMRLGYTSSKATLGAMAVDFDEDLNFSISDVQYSRESYMAAIVFRNYVGLTRRSRFAVFNDVELSFASSHGDFTRIYNEAPKLTHTTAMDAKLSFSPGCCVMVMKNVAFDLSFGVVGFYLHNEKQRTDDEESGNRFTSGANFRFNIFNINFGLSLLL